MRGRVGASFTGVLLAALALPASGCGCDDIGCLDQYVSIAAGDVPFDALPITKTLCVDDACQTFQDNMPLSTDGLPAFPVFVEASIADLGAEPLDEDTPVRISIEVVAADGTVLVDAARTVTPQRARAAGRCGPWCTSAGATYDPATGELRG